MAKRVDIGNGYIVEFPDEMSNEDITAHLAKQFPDRVPKAELKPRGNVMESEEHPPAPSVAETLTSLGENVGKGAFNVGGIIGSRINPNYEAERDARAERNPAAATAGYLTGAAAAGGPLARAARAIPGVAAVAGQGVRNVLRLAGVGAAGGAAQAGGEGKDVGLGAAEGAVAGPVGAAVAKGAVKAARGVAGLVSGAARQQNAITALASRISEDPAALQAATDRFRTATGRAPTLAEVVDAGSAEELGKVAEARRSAADTFRARGEKITAERPRAMQTQIESGGPNDTLSNLVTVRKNAMDAAMGRVANRPVHVPAGVLNDIMRDGASVLQRPLRARIADSVQNGTPLTIRDIDNMRQAFSDAADSGQRHVFTDLAGRISLIGSRAEPSYGSALSEYQAFSRGIKGYEHGSKGTLPAELKNPLDIEDARSQEYAAGRNLGVRSRLAQEAGSSERGAVTTANNLRQDAGQAAEMRAALGPRETTALQELGTAETQSATRLAQVTPAQRAPSDEVAADVRNAVERAVAIGGKTLTGYKAHVVSRLLTSASISSDTARRIAEAATDSRNLPDVIAALRRARLNDQQIREVLLPRVAATAGMAAGDVQ